MQLKKYNANALLLSTINNEILTKKKKKKIVPFM